VVQEGIGDIIVTAQRRSESLQRVPIAIALTAPETGPSKSRQARGSGHW